VAVSPTIPGVKGTLEEERIVMRSRRSSWCCGIIQGGAGRRARSVLAATCLALAFRSHPAFAQSRADIGLLGGWTKAGDERSALQFNFGTTYEASFATRILASDRVDVAIDVPFLAANSLSIKTPGAALPREYAALFLTPGIRLMVAPRGLVSVFGVVGAGFASYEESALRADGGPNPARQTNSTGAVSFGGGIDVRSGSWLGLRGEVRDVVTGARRFSIATPGDRVQHVVITVGLVIRIFGSARSSASRPEARGSTACGKEVEWRSSCSE